MDLSSEKILVFKIRQGEEKAVTTWFKLFKPYLTKIALIKVSNKKIAEDIVQETFINCLKNLSTFRFKSSLKSWMHSILRHEIADYFRKYYAKKTIKALPLSEIVLANPIDDSHVVAEKVKLVLSKMAKEKKELLLKKYVDKNRVKQIAKSMGKTVKAVESDLFRAREEFRKIYLEV
jgi:RNA polymerase sigma factor (sigma-70 family)